MWSVTGRGARAGETWTIDVPETPAPIAIWELAGGVGRIRIGSQHGLIVSNQGMTVSNNTVKGPFKASLEEWTFPVQEDVATNPTLSGTRTRTLPQGRGWRQPAGVEATETCTWNFTRAATPDLSSGTRPREDIGTIAARSPGADPAPVITALPPGGVRASAGAPPPSKPATGSPLPENVVTRPAGSTPLPDAVLGLRLGDDQ